MDYVPFNPKTELVRLVEEKFVEDFHFTLLETYPWFNLNVVEKIQKLNFDKLLSLQNPTAPENKYLRDNLFFNLLEVVSKNFREYGTIKIVEIGKVFRKWQYIEEKLVAGAMIYQKQVDNWRNNNIFVFKNAVKELLNSYKLKWLLEYKLIDEKDDLKLIWDISHPKQKAKILLNKQEIGIIFTLHPYYHKEFKIPEKAQITYLQIDLDKLIQLKLNSKQKAIEKIKYYTLEDQIVERDLSFVIPKQELYWKVLSAVSKVREIIDVEVFDIYDLWEEKSISLTIKIYGEKMTTEDINKIMDKAIKEAEKVWARLR
jgi:phenylalanyl-tRNA synthetase beta subunit